MLIAIDGPAASGKGTVARMIAAHLGLEHLDTGRLYRLVGFNLLKLPEFSIQSSAKSTKSLNSELFILATEIAKKLDISDISSEELETEEVGRAASIVSAIPEVRAALLEYQRNIAKSPKGAVLDGRDIGTVICPNADYKFYITATPEARARRRFLQLQAKGKDVKEAEILKDIISRDERDSGRSVAPLMPAIDAIYIDTTDMSAEQVFEKVKEVVTSRACC